MDPVIILTSFKTKQQVELDSLPDSLELIFEQIKKTDLDLHCYYELAVAYSKQKKVKQVQELLQSGINLATLLFEKAEPEKKIAIYDNLMKGCYLVINLCIYPNTFFDHYDEFQDILLASLDFAKAFRYARSDYSIIKGFWSIFRSDYKEALTYFEKALKRCDLKPMALLGLGYWYKFNKQYEKALEQFLQFKLIKNKDKTFSTLIQCDPAMMIAQLYLLLGKNQMAFNISMVSLKQSPKSVKILCFVGLLHLEKFKNDPESCWHLPNGDLMEPLLELNKICLRVHELDPTSPILFLFRAEIYFFQEDYEKALNLAKKAYMSEFSYEYSNIKSEAAFIIGKIQLLSGELEAANKTFFLVKKHDPHHEFANLFLLLPNLEKYELRMALDVLFTLVFSFRKEIGHFPFKPQADFQLNLIYLFFISREFESAHKKEFYRPGWKVIEVSEIIMEHKERILKTGNTKLIQFAFYTFTSLATAFQYHTHRYLTMKSLNFASELLADMSLLDQELVLEQMKVLSNLAVLNHTEHPTWKIGNPIEQLNKAEICFKNCLSENKDVVMIQIKYNLGLILESKGKLDEARKAYESIYNQFPTYHYATMRLGYIAQKQKRFEEGAKLLNEVIENNTGDTDPDSKAILRDSYLLLGNLHTHNKDLKLARFAYKTLLVDINPDDYYAICAVGNNHVRLARLALSESEKLDHYHKASGFFRKSYKLEPQNPIAINGLAVILADRKFFEPAIKVYKEMIKTHDPYYIMRNLAHAYYRLEKYQEAIAQYELTRRYYPRACDFVFLQCYARALYAYGKKIRSLDHLKLCIRTLREAIVENTAEKTLKFDLALSLQNYCVILAEKKNTNMEPERARKGLEYITEAEDILKGLSKVKEGEKTFYTLKIIQGRLFYSKTIEANVKAFVEHCQNTYVAPPVLSIEERYNFPPLEVFEEKKERIFLSLEEGQALREKELAYLAQKERLKEEKQMKEQGIVMSDDEYDQPRRTSRNNRHRFSGDTSLPRKRDSYLSDEKSKDGDKTSASQPEDQVESDSKKRQSDSQTQGSDSQEEEGIKKRSKTPSVHDEEEEVIKKRSKAPSVHDDDDEEEEVQPRLRRARASIVQDDEDEEIQPPLNQITPQEDEGQIESFTKQLEDSTLSPIKQDSKSHSPTLKSENLENPALKKRSRSQTPQEDDNEGFESQRKLPKSPLSQE